MKNTQLLKSFFKDLNLLHPHTYTFSSNLQTSSYHRLFLCKRYARMRAFNILIFVQQNIKLLLKACWHVMTNFTLSSIPDTLQIEIPKPSNNPSMHICVLQRNLCIITYTHTFNILWQDIICEEHKNCNILGKERYQSLCMYTRNSKVMNYVDVLCSPGYLSIHCGQACDMQSQSQLQLQFPNINYICQLLPLQNVN